MWKKKKRNTRISLCHIVIMFYINYSHPFSYSYSYIYKYIYIFISLYLFLVIILILFIYWIFFFCILYTVVLYIEIFVLKYKTTSQVWYRYNQNVGQKWVFFLCCCQFVRPYLNQFLVYLFISDYLCLFVYTDIHGEVILFKHYVVVRTI